VKPDVDEKEPGGRSGAVLWLVRIVLFLAAVFLLREGLARFRQWEGEELLSKAVKAVTWTNWWVAIALVAMAALLFTFALRIPYRGRGFAWWTLVVAALALVPAVDFWYVITRIPSQAGWLGKFWWWDYQEWEPVVFSALAGVAVACGVGNRKPLRG
jgi:hypothetical protein